MPQGPTIVDVADDMSLKVRTLQRRLAASGVPYRTMLDDCRRQRALAAVQAGTLSVSDIAQNLGYSDPSHFVRAFHRWTGHAPTHYRRTRRDGQ
jgi:AraC-like DNA-binding protein